MNKTRLTRQRGSIGRFRCHLEIANAVMKTPLHLARSVLRLRQVSSMTAWHRLGSRLNLNYEHET